MFDIVVVLSLVYILLLSWSFGFVLVLCCSWVFYLFLSCLGLLFGLDFNIEKRIFLHGGLVGWVAGLVL